MVYLSLVDIASNPPRKKRLSSDLPFGVLQVELDLPVGTFFDKRALSEPIVFHTFSY